MCYNLVMLTRTYEFKLKPTAKQVSIFESWLIACRKVYNYALAERKVWVNSRKCEINACSLEVSIKTLSATNIVYCDGIRTPAATQT